MTRLIARFGTSWRICSHNGESGDAESRRTAPNGDKRVAIWESPPKRAVTICRSPRKFTRGATFIVARIAKKNFRASAAFAARLHAWPAAENITEENSTHVLGCAYYRKRNYARSRLPRRRRVSRLLPKT